MLGQLICALGCTEPIALAYAAALARLVLGCEPEKIAVGCSGNIVKNVKSVTVPNSGGMRGVEAAAVLGAVGGDASAALETLEGVTDEHIARTRELLEREGYVEVSLIEGGPNLYIEVRAEALGHVAEVAISEHHTNVVRCTRDGVPTSISRCAPRPWATWRRSPSRSTTPTWCAARATASRRTVCAPPRAPGGTWRMRARERARS